MKKTKLLSRNLKFSHSFWKYENFRISKLFRFETEMRSAAKNFQEDVLSLLSKWTVPFFFNYSTWNPPDQTTKFNFKGPQPALSSASSRDQKSPFTPPRRGPHSVTPVQVQWARTTGFCGRLSKPLSILCANLFLTAMFIVKIR